MLFIDVSILNPGLRQFHNFYFTFPIHSTGCFLCLSKQLCPCSTGVCRETMVQHLNLENSSKKREEIGAQQAQSANRKRTNIQVTVMVCHLEGTQVLLPSGEGKTKEQKPQSQREMAAGSLLKNIQSNIESSSYNASQGKGLQDWQRPEPLSNNSLLTSSLSTFQIPLSKA